MRKEEAKKRIAKLRKVIRRHRYLYHILDKQEISDAALDSLKHELKQLEDQHPEFITPDSPTQRVGGKPLEKFEKVEHKMPMLSIEDIFSEEELRDWQNYLQRLAPREQWDYFSEFKIDGFAVSLIYENGSLKQGATRGNGKIGEDVTANLKTIESIPLRLEKSEFPPAKLEVRGEVYMTKKGFEEVNKKRKRAGEEPYANPRNLAAGSIRQLDPKLTASRPLKFLAYDIVTDLGQKTHAEEHEMLKKLGFRTDDTAKKCKDLTEVIDYWRDAAKKRETLPFQVDGVVVQVNNNALFERLGVAGKSPRAIRAFKFSPKQATTKVKDIKLHVGRTGVVTPIAVLEPVQIGGATISRATLHNEDEIRRLGLKIGDTVIVERAGDVIPAIVKVLSDLRTGREKSFSLPRGIRGHKLIRPKGEVAWYCPTCPERNREYFYFFVSKKGFDIEGLGPKIVDQLTEEGLVSSPPELFELREGDLVPLERFAEKSAKNLIEAIAKSKAIPLARFINSLGIRHVGEETAASLAQYFGSLQNLRQASAEELEKVPDIGSIVARSIANWFADKNNIAFLKKLQEAGIKILLPEKQGRNLKGLTFVFTGSLSSMTRQEAERKVRLEGGDPSSSVSKNTDYLVAGENPGSKYNEAKKLGVKIISEKEFLKML